ncbi:MAG: hypothetical protein ABI416_11595 [Ginsengibacter sp.]
MQQKFFSFDWKQVEGEKVLKSDSFFYSASAEEYDSDDMKSRVIKLFSLDPSAVIVIENIAEISKEQYEILSGLPLPF